MLVVDAHKKRNAQIHWQTWIAVFVSVGVVEREATAAFVEVSKHFAKPDKAFAFLQFFVNTYFIADKGCPKSFARKIFVNHLALLVFKNYPERALLLNFNDDG